MKISIAISTFLLGLTRLAMPALAAVAQEDVITKRQVQENVPPEVRNSHLVCHKARDKKPIRPALISLIANEVQNDYSLERCRVYFRDVELCVPATKKVLSDQDFPPQLMNLQPQELKNDFLCYSIRCRGDSKAPKKQVAANQFGKYNLKIFKTKQKVCIPSWKLREDGSPVIVE